MTIDIKELAKNTSDELLSLIGFSAQTSVSEEVENEAIAVQIETEEAGILIGRHGETITSFQLILNQIVANYVKTDNIDAVWPRILVNCGDYRERQEESLRNMALGTAERVKENGAPESIYDLTPAQRRIVHMALSEDPAIETRSEGEGRERHLVVEPVKQ